MWRKTQVMIKPTLMSCIRRPVAMTLCASLAWAAAVAPAQAKTGDRNQPMLTKQDSVSGFNAPNTVTTLNGHVVVTQGTMKTTGALGKIYLDADTQVSRIVMTGSPAHIEQRDDDNNL